MDDSKIALLACLANATIAALTASSSNLPKLCSDERASGVTANFDADIRVDLAKGNSSFNSAAAWRPIKGFAQILSTWSVLVPLFPMHAALISLVLMSGACGDLPPPEGVTVSVSAPATDGCGGVGCGWRNLTVPPLYCNCPQNAPSPLRTAPAWKTDYHPAAYFYPNHRMLFDPADYTRPYGYREQFNYPWNDPRCRCTGPSCCQ